MKVKSFFGFAFVVLCVVTLAFSPMPTAKLQAPAMDTLDVIVKIALGFASLYGVSKLVAILVQIFKVVGLAKDNTANQWTAAFNLIAFVALIYFGVFQPQITMEIFDGYAAQIADIALIALGFMVQMTNSKPTYDALKQSRLPLLSYSHSRNA